MTAIALSHSGRPSVTTVVMTRNAPTIIRSPWAKLNSSVAL